MLDAHTLFTVATCVTGLLGVLLLIVWVQERSIRALAWWGAAYLMGGSAVALWSGQDNVPFITPAAPNALLFVACGLIWSGARLFHGRRVLPAALIAGSIAWFVAMQASAFAESEFARIVLSSLIIASYTFLTAYELRRERRRALARPWLTIGVPLLHGAVFLSPVPLTALLPPGSHDGWLALFALETLLYVVGTAFIVVVMAKERVLLAHKAAAMTDALTGLFNRRAFLVEAERLILRQARSGSAVSVLMFDLDHFKSINDRFGHAVGDDALRLFAQTAVANIRGNDVFGRLGGEEFAAILHGPQSEAVVVAERVRAAFEAAGVEISGHRIGATVSIGAAEALPPAAIDSLLARADAALYRAKEKGRNRIETSLPAAPVQAPPLAPSLEPVPA